jgi:hypothetical protein
MVHHCGVMLALSGWAWPASMLVDSSHVVGRHVCFVPTISQSASLANAKIVFLHFYSLCWWAESNTLAQVQRQRMPSTEEPIQNPLLAQDLTTPLLTADGGLHGTSKRLPEYA